MPVEQEVEWGVPSLLSRFYMECPANVTSDPYYMVRGSVKEFRPEVTRPVVAQQPGDKVSRGVTSRGVL